jgi:hypothetical protein
MYSVCTQDQGPQHINTTQINMFKIYCKTKIVRATARKHASQFNRVSLYSVKQNGKFRTDLILLLSEECTTDTAILKHK